MFIVIIRKKRYIQCLLALFIFAVSIFILSASAISVENKEEKRKAEVPIIMYHSILKNQLQWGEYVVSPKILESDICYLKDHHYTAVVMQDLINYVYYGRPLPEKPVMLTFDDGFYNNMIYVYPLLEKYDMKAVISPVGAYSDSYTNNPDPNPAYAYLTWDNIKDLSKSGRIEIQNHSYDMHSNTKRKGASKMRNESDEDYANVFVGDTLKMQYDLQSKAQVYATAYTYPFGKISKESKKLLKSMGFLASLSCCEHGNKLSRNPDDLYELGRYNRGNHYGSTENFMRKAGII